MIIPTRGVSCEAAAFIAMFPEIKVREINLDYSQALIRATYYRLIFQLNKI